MGRRIPLLSLCNFVACCMAHVNFRRWNESVKLMILNVCCRGVCESPSLQAIMTEKNTLQFLTHFSTVCFGITIQSLPSTFFLSSFSTQREGYVSHLPCAVESEFTGFNKE